MVKRRKSWSNDDMIEAVRAVKKGQMGTLAASKKFNVPRGTVRDYAKKQESPSSLVSKSLGRKPVLSEELEQKLVEYCVDIDNRFFGLRKCDVTRMAAQLAIKNNISHPFKNETAGRYWFKSFMQRHPNLSLRTPRATSHARALGFSRENVENFFNLYEIEYEKVKRQPHRIFNVDETGICVVQHKMSKIITLKGKKDVSALTSAERGKLVTVVVCMNAVGTFIPPLLIWPRKNMKIELMDGAPAGAIWACHPSGWIQSDIFTMWFDHFIKYTNPTEDNPVLLILDGHNTHTRNIDVLIKAKQHNISILCLPPHSSHKMQPLDVGFMKPLKSYYCSEIETFLRNHPEKQKNNEDIVTAFRIARLFGAAYNRSATMTVSVNSFKKTGLYPMNRNVFDDYQFITPVVTSSDLFESDNIIRNEVSIQIEPVPSTSQTDNNSSALDKTINTQIEPVPGTSNAALILPVDINPLPYLKPKISNRQGTATLLTTTNYIENLEQSVKRTQNRKGRKAEKKEKKSNAVARALFTKKRGRKMKQIESSTDDSDIEEGLIISTDEDDDISEDGDAECLFCGNMFKKDKHGEEWFQCSICYRWGHENCGATELNFICPPCKIRSKC